MRYSLSYRDVEELLTERGLPADHTTIWRWVQRFAPELNKRCRGELKPTNGSWRVDETYIPVAGEWKYLYRAVDSTGATVERKIRTDGPIVLRGKACLKAAVPFSGGLGCPTPAISIHCPAVM